MVFLEILASANYAGFCSDSHICVLRHLKEEPVWATDKRFKFTSNVNHFITKELKNIRTAAISLKQYGMHCCVVLSNH